MKTNAIGYLEFLIRVIGCSYFYENKLLIPLLLNAEKMFLANIGVETPRGKLARIEEMA